MLVKISYFIFGIITITTGKPTKVEEYDSSNVNNDNVFQQLLQSLANQATYDVASYHKKDLPNAYHENRAGASGGNEKTRQLYYNNDKADSQQNYESRENVDERELNIDSLQTINKLLGNKPEYDNDQTLLQDLLSANRNNKFKLSKPNDNADNVDEVVAFLDNLQKKVTDDRHNRNIYGYSETNRDNLESPLLLGEIDKYGVSDQVKPVLAQPKVGIMKLLKNLVGYKPRLYELDYDYGSVLNVNSDRDNLRCNGKNCARTINDNRLRCRGKNCARTRNDDDIKYNSKLSAQKVKLNDDLDAVVLGLSDVEHLLTNLNVQKQPRKNKRKGAKLLENVDLENLLSSKSEKGNVEAIVFDLTKVENSDAIAKQIKQLLSQPTNDEYEEYGNVVEDHLKQGLYDIKKQVGADREKARILPHKENNNNVYLPQWLLDEVIAKTYGDKESANEYTSLIPLKQQRKEKLKAIKQNRPQLYRRNFKQDIGVPFHLEVKGLGQVNP